MYILILVPLGLALVGLVVLDVRQRRGVGPHEPASGPSVLDAPPRTAAEPVSRPPAAQYQYSPRAERQPAGVMTIAVGVWLGLWLFVISAAVPVIAIMVWAASHYG